MNVLSCGLPFGTPGEPLRHYVSAKGHEVRTIAWDGTGDYTYTAEDLAPELLARINEDWPVDLWLCWCPEVSPPPRQIEDADVQTVAIVSDWSIYHPQLAYNLARFDMVVCDALGAQTLKIPGAAPRYFGPIYSQRTGVHEYQDLDRDIDIAFAGNLNHAVHERRGRLLEKVAALSDRYNVVIASELDDTAYTELLNRSRIVFNTSLRREMNLRCFEALACGALLFVAEDNLEVRDLLDTEEDCVLYSEDNLVPLLEHFLTHPHELNHRAASGHAKSRDIAGESRLDELLETWAASSGQFRSFQDWPPSHRALADVLFYSSAPDPAHRAFARERLHQATEQFPDDLELRVADSIAQLESLSGDTPEARKAALPGVLESLQQCASTSPNAAPLWLNLAYTAKSAGVLQAEQRFLELTLEATDTTFGNLMIGDRNEVYYARWREALAFGNDHIDMLHAAAAARLAAIALNAGDSDRSRELAIQSEDLFPGIAAPYRTLAAVSEPDAAVELLQESLPFTSFDSAHRLALIDALEAAGRIREAENLAIDSMEIFDAWRAAAHVADAFRARAEALAAVAPA